MEASRQYQETVDADTFHPRDPDAADRAEAPAPGAAPLPLPAPQAGGSGQGVQLGQAVQMDHLGPMVVGEDGSLSRIANWGKLTEREREVALRRITARNRERLARLRGAGEAAAGVAAAGAGVAAGGQAAAEQQPRSSGDPQ